MRPSKDDLRNRVVRIADVLLMMNQESLIMKVEELLANSAQSHDPKELSQEQLLARLEASEADIRDGRTIGSEELLAEIEGW